jgi:hypothetical protein
MSTTSTDTPETDIYLFERTLRVPRGFAVGTIVTSPGRNYRYVTRNRDSVTVLCPVSPADDEIMSPSDMRSALNDACDAIAAARVLARRGGSSRSPQKAAAARANGASGGRPNSLTGGRTGFAHAIDEAFGLNVHDPVIRYSHTRGFHAESKHAAPDPDVLWERSIHYVGSTGRRSVRPTDYAETLHDIHNPFLRIAITIDGEIKADFDYQYTAGEPPLDSTWIATQVRDAIAPQMHPTLIPVSVNSTGQWPTTREFVGHVCAKDRTHAFRAVIQVA